MGGGIGGNFGNTWGSSLDSLSNLLAGASIIPGLDTFTNLASIPVDLVRGDFVSAGLSAIGALPFVGEVADVAKVTRIADKAIDAAKTADKAVDATKAVKTSKTVDKVSNVARGTTKVSTTKLTQTHKLTMSKKQYGNLIESIRKNGIIEPIKFVEYKGTKYVVDGHHRLSAAKQLKLEKIPAQKVTLPYKGYKTIDDILWFD